MAARRPLAAEAAGRPPGGRNADWEHLNNADIISMPDKWEYPWYAAWDLAFHCIALAHGRSRFRQGPAAAADPRVVHAPERQLPAYEWAFGDVNPPVHAWAARRVYQIDRERNGVGDRAFLEAVFHKLMLNFTWWVNRKDAEGRNVFQGGFLGLDNIGIFDRSAPLPTGGHINQADGTAWMAMYSLNLMRIALALAEDNHVYEDVATKFFEHFLYIAQAMTNIGGSGIGLWDEADQFYYDVLQLPDGESDAAAGAFDGRADPAFRGRGARRLRFPAHARIYPEAALVPRLPADLAALVSRWNDPNSEERHLLSLLRGHRMKRLLARMLDESEFLSDYGVRAVSKRHEHEPFVFEHQGDRFSSAMCRAKRRTNAVWRQLELARPDLDAGQLSADRVAATLSPLLRRRVQGRMSDRLRTHYDARRGRERIVAPPVTTVPEGRQRTGGPVFGELGAAPQRSRVSRSRAVLRIFPRRYRARHRRFAPDRLDRAGRAVAGGLARDAAQEGDRAELAVAAE